MNASGRTVTPGDLYAVTVRRGKYQDGVPYQAGQKIQPGGDGSTTHILEAFGASAGGETINFKRLTDAELRKMESSAAEGENVAEVAGDGEGDGEYSISSAHRATTLDEIVVKFKRNPKHNTEEFSRQLKAQEEGMNKLSVEEYLLNRSRYLAEGRGQTGSAAQRIARENAYLDKVSELRRSGLNEETANNEARKWIVSQAALHNPDQIAGGYPNNVDGVGDSEVNSSIGSQWKNLVRGVDEKIINSVKGWSSEDRARTLLKIKLDE